MASAQDSNGDGCVDSYYDSDSACVAPSASIASGVQILLNSVVGEYASIGQDTTIGGAAYVGSRTIITGRVAAVGQLSMGADTAIGRSVTIGADHTLGNSNTIGRGSSIGARIETEDSVSIGRGAIIGDDAFFGSGAVLGSLVQVGDNTTIASGAVLARGVTILDSPTSATIDGIVGPDTQIGTGADIASTARIRKRVIIGDDVTILGGVRIGRDAQIGDGATIGLNVRIAAGGQVTANSNVPDGTVISQNEEFDNAVGSFTGGTLVSPSEQTQLNQWVGDPDANWELCYKRSVDGVSSAAFHSGCDSYAGTVTVVQSGSLKIGGYTPMAWSGTGYNTEGTHSSFLFSLTNNHRHDYLQYTYDIYRNPAYGPTWGGGHDLMVDRDASTPYCNLGHTYSCRPGFTGNACRVDFCGTTGAFTLTEVEVYGRL
jgi:UDP-3-O-[3-hydroxymyristoyl] glucosamine N-acyltransferase